MQNENGYKKGLQRDAKWQKKRHKNLLKNYKITKLVKKSRIIINNHKGMQHDIQNIKERDTKILLNAFNLITNMHKMY